MCPTCGVTYGPSITRCPNDFTELAAVNDPRSEVIQELSRDPAFNGYQFLGTIGSGGMGVIYKARQLLLDKLVAIKMVHTHLVSSEAFQRFQLEGKASALLKHENIIAVLVMGVTENGQPFMIMDYVDGKTFRPNSWAREHAFHAEISAHLRTGVRGSRPRTQSRRVASGHQTKQYHGHPTQLRQRRRSDYGLRYRKTFGRHRVRSATLDENR